MDTPHIVKHVAEFDGIRLILKFVFVGFSHGVSRPSLSTPLKWVADAQPSGYASTVGFQRDTIVIQYFRPNVKFIFS